MARFYTNENIACQVVAELRRFGHDVLTSLEAGKANASVQDPEVLAFASTEGRILLSHNRRHFLQLHQRRTENMLESYFALSIRILQGKRIESTQPSPPCQTLWIS